MFWKSTFGVIIFFFAVIKKQHIVDLSIFVSWEMSVYIMGWFYTFSEGQEQTLQPLSTAIKQGVADTWVNAIHTNALTVLSVCWQYLSTNGNRVYFRNIIHLAVP